MSSVDAQAVAALAARAKHEVESGASTAAQFAIGLHGEIVAAQSFGTATDQSRFVIFSATKTLVAMALLPHLTNGALQLTARVGSYLPGFADNGKGDVTVLQLLTMQGGFPQALIGPKHWGTSAGRREQFADWTLEWPAGSRTEYHPIAAHWVIAELIETLSGHPYQQQVHDLITEPAGATRVLGEPVGPVINVRVAGEVADRAEMARVFGRNDLVPDTTVSPEALLSLNIPMARAAGIPGGGGIARATDIALVYQHFLHNRGGVLPQRWLDDAIGTIRNGSLNTSDGTPASRTIAGCMAGADGYWAHRWFPNLPAAFGHHGAGGQLCWLEPTTGLSFCFLHDTLQQNPCADFVRSRELNALAACVVGS